MTKLLTKSLFTTALECPRKLYYAVHGNEYDNTNSDNDFLRSLADGGIQVGALARHYYKSKYRSFGYHYIETKDKKEALRQTKDAMQQNNVVIAEAAFEWNGCFVRADILVKRGKTIQLIEVKSSSINQEEQADVVVELTPKGEVNKAYRHYIYDLAFQKYVVENALGCDVCGYLMLINTNKPCDMDMVCDAIIAGQTTEQADYMGATFTDYVDMLVGALQSDNPLQPRISSHCKGCEFRNDGDTERSGFHHCWKQELGFTDDDFRTPLSMELWRGRSNDFIANKKYFLADLQWADYSKASDSSLSIGDTEFTPSTRKQIQIEKRTSGNTDAVLLSGIKEEMAEWRFPLHFIDFETSTVALPFTKGRYPYETTAFQYSHHQLDANGKLIHTEWISTERVFPNFDFVRALKADLDKDSGTIFRYSHHENSVLNQIAEQLRLSNEADRDELIAFIHSITHDTSGKREGGERDMVDLCEVVVRFFYDPSMKGSNSIKVVLPAVLRSKELQKKYARPYREYVQSDNFVGFDFSLINYNDNGEVGNPYKYLPAIGAESVNGATDSNDILNNGGLANANYAKLQYDGLTDEEKLKLKNALLRYCELDTMAMVLIYEFFKIHSK